MKMFAVGMISFFENEVVVEIIVAEDVKSAIASHSMIKSDEHMAEYVNEMPNSLDEIKSMLIDGEMGVDVVEIPRV